MKKPHWQDWGNLLLGVWVVSSPWIFEHAMEVPKGATAVTGAGMWNFYVIGGIVAVVSILALISFDSWKHWVNLVLGCWLVVSPWVLNLTISGSLTWNAVVAGTLVVSLAGWVLYEEREGPV